MRVLTHYNYEFTNIKDALDHLRSHRRVEDIEVRTGSDDLIFDGDMVSVHGAEPIRMSGAFLRAFCDRVEPHLPLRFASKLPADLFETNANRLMHMVKNRGQRLTVRVETWLNDDGSPVKRTAQSLVTDVCQFIDHEDVLERALAINGRPISTKVVLTDELLRVNAIVTAFDVTDRQGEAEHFQIGYDLVNSETRNTRIVVASFLERLVCANGAVAAIPGFGGSYGKRHVVDPDKALDKVESILATIDWAGSNRAFYMRLQEMIANEVSRETIWRHRIDAEAIAGPALTREFWEQPWPETVTEFDVFNRMTRLARDLAADSKHSLEVVAGKSFLSFLGDI